MCNLSLQRSCLPRYFFYAGAGKSLAILRNSSFRGLLAIPDLQRTLSHLPENANQSCLFAVDSGWNARDQQLLLRLDILDLTPWINTTPTFLDIETPLELVHQLLLRLGTRIVCIAIRERLD